MIPPDRLQLLMAQALTYQVSECKFHSDFQKTHSLLEDHYCENELFAAKTIQIIEGIEDEMWDAVFSHDGEALAGICKNGNVYIWDFNEQGFTKRLEIDNAHNTHVLDLS